MIVYLMVMFELFSNFGKTGREILSEIIQLSGPDYQLTELIKVHSESVLDISVEEMEAHGEVELWVTFGVNVQFEDSIDSFINDARKIVRVKQASEIEAFDISFDQFVEDERVYYEDLQRQYDAELAAYNQGKR